MQLVLWIASSTETVCELLSQNSGADVVLIDGQHGAFGLDQALALVTATSRGKATAGIRVSNHYADAEICRFIDAGARIVICPMINSKQDCETFVRHCYYPPIGTRSYGPYRHKLTSGFSIDAMNRQVSCLAMIETKLALGALDEILSVPHLSGVFIGPNDLSISMGFAPTSSPQGKVKEAIEFVLRKTKARRMECGIFCSDVATAKEMKKLGFNFIVVGTDLSLVMSAVQGRINELSCL